MPVCLPDAFGPSKDQVWRKKLYSPVSLVMSDSNSLRSLPLPIPLATTDFAEQCTMPLRSVQPFVVSHIESVSDNSPSFRRSIASNLISLKSGLLPVRITASRQSSAPRELPIKRVNCDQAPYPPDGQTREWWHRLKNAFGTASSAFVEASLHQLIAAARLPNSGIERQLGVHRGRQAPRRGYRNPGLICE